MAEWPIANRIEQVNGDSGFIQTVDEVTVGAYASQEVQFRARETDFLWTAAVAVATGTFRVRIFSETDAKFLDNNPIRSELFWGTAQLPNRHAPKFIPLNGQMNFTIQDTSNASNTIALYLVGMRARTCGGKSCANDRCPCDRGRWGTNRGLYILGTPVNQTDPTQDGITVGANAPMSSSLKIEDALHFRASQINASATSASWRGRMKRMDPRDERTAWISNAQMRSAAWTGVSTAPFRPTSPILMHKGSDVEFDLTDLSGATNYVRFALVGERLTDELVRQNA
jgi:hypothetical protein